MDSEEESKDTEVKEKETEVVSKVYLIIVDLNSSQ